MKDQLKCVYKMHCIDKQATALRAQMAEVTESDEYKRKMESADRAVAATNSDLIRIDANIKDTELKLQSLETKLADYEKKYSDGSVKNAKELTNIDKEIQLLKVQKSKIDAELISMYEISSTLRAKFAKATNASQVWRKRYDAAYKKETRAREAMEKQMRALLRQRKSCAETITDKQLLNRYEAISERVGDTGAAVVTDKRCESCHVAITHFIVRVLESGSDYETCESCGRILLNPKECEE